jgi:GNAT superfamily N-acetyltransferase
MGQQTMQIRPAVMADVAALAQLAGPVFRETYGAAIPAAILAPYLARTFTPAAFAAMLGAATTTLFVVMVDGVIGGYAKLLAAPIPGDAAPAVEMSTLYLDRRYQKLGLGKALMHHALRWAAAQGYSTMWLCVWQANRPALTFYQRLGFVISGETVIWVDGVRFDDWIMQRSTTASHTTPPSPAPASAPYSASTTPPLPPPTRPAAVHSAS